MGRKVGVEVVLIANGGVLGVRAVLTASYLALYGADGWWK